MSWDASWHKHTAHIQTARSQIHINNGTQNTYAIYTECGCCVTGSGSVQCSLLLLNSANPVNNNTLIKDSVTSNVSLLMRTLQQRAGTCCFGQWSVHETDRCPSSVLGPAGPACWVPESKAADPGPALTNHPEPHCPRGQIPDNLWASICFIFSLWFLFTKQI